jgi:aldose 1-epimerase
VWYVQKKEEANGVQQEVLYIEYEAELVGDEVEETGINMTNHRYQSPTHHDLANC